MILYDLQFMRLTLPIVVCRNNCSKNALLFYRILGIAIPISNFMKINIHDPYFEHTHFKPLLWKIWLPLRQEISDDDDGV